MPFLPLEKRSGRTIGARAEVLPLSTGGGELADTASCVAPLPEIFTYYLQGGRVRGLPGAVQIDRFGNLNSTVVGPPTLMTNSLPETGTP